MSFVFLNGCSDFLEPQVSGAVTQDILANKKGVHALLIGAYASFTGPHSSLGKDAVDNWVYGSVAGGEAHKGSLPTDQPPINQFMNMEVLPTNGFLNTKWITLYEGVSRANSVLEMLSKVNLKKEKEIAGEARFIRGHYYFELKKMFGNVPWVDQNTKNYRSTNYGPNAADIWKKIEQDFKFAYQNLPKTQPAVGRANKWAAATYLAKAYIWQEKWKKALPLLKTIMEKGVTSSGIPYKLQDNYGWNFLAIHENSSEDIFSVQFTGKDGTGTYYNARRGDRLNYPLVGDQDLIVAVSFSPPQIWLIVLGQIARGSHILKHIINIQLKAIWGFHRANILPQIKEI